MKLDLLYEFQPALRPYAEKPFPYGQREAERQVYTEAIEQIQLADKLGFKTVWCVEHHFREKRSACPTPEAVLGGLALTTKDIRLGFGVVLMPFGFTSPARVAEKGGGARLRCPEIDRVSGRPLSVFTSSMSKTRKTLETLAASDGVRLSSGKRTPTTWSSPSSCDSSRSQ